MLVEEAFGYGKSLLKGGVADIVVVDDVVTILCLFPSFSVLFSFHRQIFSRGILIQGASRSYYEKHRQGYKFGQSWQQAEQEKSFSTYSIASRFKAPCTLS
jgi:hypothetical protein